MKYKWHINQHAYYYCPQTTEEDFGMITDRRWSSKGGYSYRINCEWVEEQHVHVAYYKTTGEIRGIIELAFMYYTGRNGLDKMIRSMCRFHGIAIF